MRSEATSAGRPVQRMLIGYPVVCHAGAFSRFAVRVAGVGRFRPLPRGAFEPGQRTTATARP